VRWQSIIATTLTDNWLTYIAVDVFKIIEGSPAWEAFLESREGNPFPFREDDTDSSGGVGPSRWAKATGGEGHAVFADLDRDRGR
jgi:hypothetical protein